MKKWETVKLGDTASFYNGYPFKPEEWAEEGLPIIRIQNLNDPNKPYNYFAEDLDSRYIVEDGDILISWSGSLGVFEWSRGRAALNQHIFKVGFNKLDIDKNFFRHLIGSQLEKMAELAHGATMKHITKKDFDKIEIPLPPLSEQKRIAGILDAADRLRQQDKALIGCYNQLAQSVFLEMFGDPVRNERGWEVIRLDQLCRLERGRFSPRPRNDPSYFGGKYPFIQTGDISRSGNRLSTFSQTLNEKGIKVSKEFKNGVIVIAIVGATIGATAILDIDVYATDSIIGITPKPTVANAQFVEYVLRFWKPILLESAPESARPNINLEILNKLKIPIIPLPLQQKFAEVIENIEHQKAQAEASGKESEGLFQSLLQSAFKGEL